MNFKNISFDKSANTEFISELRQRVNSYFNSNNISIYANWKMVLKTVLMLSIYLTPYFLMIFGVIENIWLMLAMWVVMGIGQAGIGLSVMHDACHGAYSRKKRVNDFIGQIMVLIGGSSSNWKVQHNILHHTYTNVDGIDEDIDPGKLMRFSPHQKRYKHQRFQYIYAWFFYGLMTVSWSLTKDFKQVTRYKRKGMSGFYKRSYNNVFLGLVLSKMFYYTYLVVIPILVLDVSWWMVLVFYFVQHFVSGFILSIIFQPAHVMPQTAYPLPNKEGVLENDWAIHQLYTTTNFAPNSTLFSWYVGGLNFQIEHHLFPNICHVHYKKISEIVQKTALEYGLPYYSQPKFVGAIAEHAKILKKFGKYDVV